jgi:ATP-dependent DNA helicase PIF1
VQDLIDDVYQELNAAHFLGPVNAVARRKYLLGRAILTAKNADVDTINNQVMGRFTLGEGGDVERVYHSADSVTEEHLQNVFLPEYLNTLAFSGVPPHELKLKVGCPIMLLRNMPGGLANGTRLIVKQLLDNVIVAEFTEDAGNGGERTRTVFIPRLDITPTDNEKMPFTFTRRQFPVRPAFAMTVNKSQGQTLKMVGLFLPESVFSHGQLYVALSRVGDRLAIRVMVVGGLRDDGKVYTSNVVYHEVFEP